MEPLLSGARMQKIRGSLKLHTKILQEDVKRADLFKQASAMAYTTLFSLIPSLAGVFTLLSLFLPFLGNNAKLMDEFKEFVLKNLATGSGEQVLQYLDKFLAGLDFKKIGWTSFAGVMFTLILLLKQIEEALNRIWNVQQGRPLMSRFIYFWTFLTLGTFVLSMVLGLSSSLSIGRMLQEKTVVVTSTMGSWFIVSHLTNWLSGCLFFFLLYKIGPNCFVSLRAALLGAGTSGTLFYLASTLYGIYVRDFNNYKTIYGTLAAVPLFLMWLYICWLIIMFGALVTWRIQTGYPEIRSHSAIELTDNHAQKLRNKQIVGLLPYLILAEIYHGFSLGKGEGVTVSHLVNHFKLPQDWILEGTHVLTEVGLVFAKQMYLPANQEEEDPQFYPSYPAERLSLKTVEEKLSGLFERWMSQLGQRVPPPLQMAYHYYEKIYGISRDFPTLDSLCRIK